MTKNTLEKRFKGHITGVGYYFAKALRKHGLDSFLIEQIDSAETEEEMFEKEVYWIDRLDSLYPNGYNLTKGGNGNTNRVGDYTLSPETCKAISLALTGIKVSVETREKLSKALKGLKRGPIGPHSEETKRKISEGNKGKVLSQETKDKLSKAFTGRKRTPESLEKCKATWAIRRAEREANNG